MATIQKIDYYETLQLTRTASQQDIKQSYKRLALVHHPDKNQGTEDSKVKFRQISEAYSILNDPKKRQNYDKFGVADVEGIDFEQFMQSFGAFDEFLTQILSFNTFDAMFSGINKKRTKKGASKPRGRVKGRQKGFSGSDTNQMFDLIMGGGSGEDALQKLLMQALLQQAGGDDLEMKGMQKQIKKIIKASGNDDFDFGKDDEDEQEDDEDLTQQQMQILQFGQKNIQKKKVGNKKKKKTQTRCKLDGLKIEQDEVLMHFSQNHMQQFKKWQKQTEGQQVKKQTNKKSQKQQQEIQY